MTTISAEEREEWRAQHIEEVEGACSGCSLYYPCPTIRLLDAMEAAEQLLATYGRHNEGCSAEQGDQYICRCGWREAGLENK